MFRPCCAMVLWSLSLVGALDPNEVFFNFEELAKPRTSTTSTASQDFAHHTEHGSTMLKYDVELRDDAHFLHLDDEPTVTGVVCNGVPTSADGSLILTFSDKRRADSLINAEQPVLVSGSHRWKCLDANGRHTNLLFRGSGTPRLLEEAPHDGSLRVQIDVTSATYHHFFKHANIQFSTSIYPEEWFAANDHATPETNPRSRKLSETQTGPTKFKAGGIWDFLKKGWNAVVATAKSVAHAVEAVEEVVEALVTGDYETNKTLYQNSWSWNYDLSKRRIINPSIPIGNGITCDGCAATASFEIVFTLDIKNYDLQNMRFVGQGKMMLDVGTQLQLFSSLSAHYETLLTTIHMKPIKFSVFGVPFILNTDIPIALGFDVEFSTAATVDAAFQASGDFTFGVEYTPYLGMRRISESHFDHSGNLHGVSTADISTTLYVLPTVQMQVNYIGGPNIGVKVFSEVLLELNPPFPRPCKGSSALAVNLGIQVTIGGSVDIHFSGKSFYNHTFEPRSVWSGKFPILSGCRNLSKDRKEIQQLSADAIAGGLAMAWPPSDKRRQMRDPYRFSRHFSKTAAAAPLTATTPTLVLAANGDFLGYASVEQLACAEGVTWRGDMIRGPGSSPECRQYPERRSLSFQTYKTTVTGTGPILHMIGSVNDAHQLAKYSCVKQQEMVASIYTSGYLTFSLVNDPSLEYSFCTETDNACSCDAPATMLPTRFVGETDSELNSITFEDSQRCTVTTIYRMAPKTSGAYYDHLAQSFNRSSAASCGMY